MHRNPISKNAFQRPYKKSIIISTDIVTFQMITKKAGLPINNPAFLIYVIVLQTIHFNGVRT